MIAVQGYINPPSVERMDFLEATFRIKWPDLFRDFIRGANGGIPEKQELPTKDEKAIERFLCVTEVPREAPVPFSDYDIAVVISQLDERLIEDEDAQRIPIIPFGALFAGDFLCLDFRMNSQAPSIVVWDHELSDELQPHVREVFGSFKNFIEYMQE